MILIIKIKERIMMEYAGMGRDFRFEPKSGTPIKLLVKGKNNKLKALSLLYVINLH